MTPAQWIAALLLVFPRMAHRECVVARRDRIAAAATAAAAEHHVPVVVLLTVAYLETHLGCDPRSGGNWGAPSDRAHRHRAGTAATAASALALGYRRCHTDAGAVASFRWGLCREPRRHTGYGPRDVLILAERVVERGMREQHMTERSDDYEECSQ